MEIIDLLAKEIANLQQELEKAHENTSDLEDQLAEVIRELETKNPGINATDCRICAQDTYEQQQNYEHLKEQLQKEIKELKWYLSTYQAREKNDWGTWRDKAIELEKQNKFLLKDRNTWESWCHSSNELLEAEEQRLKSSEKEIVKLKERTKVLKERLIPLEKEQLEKEISRIEWENAGHARR